MEGESESATLVHTSREYINVTLIRFYQVLADHQAHSDTLIVRVGSSKKFAELLEQLAHFILFDALTCVHNVKVQLLPITIVGDNDPNRAAQGELECILD